MMADVVRLQAKIGRPAESLPSPVEYIPAWILHHTVIHKIARRTLPGNYHRYTTEKVTASVNDLLGALFVLLRLGRS
jgi:hypothetical protein